MTLLEQNENSVNCLLFFVVVVVVVLLVSLVSFSFLFFNFLYKASDKERFQRHCIFFSQMTHTLRGWRFSGHVQVTGVAQSLSSVHSPAGINTVLCLVTWPLRAVSRCHQQIEP